MTAAANLMMEIVKCGLDCKDSAHPCHSIWESQGCEIVGDFHLPEPWNGSIDSARLMFLGINPRYNAGELFPRIGNPWWMTDGQELSSSRITDFFTRRFSSEDGYVVGVPDSAVRVRIESASTSERVYREAGGVYWKYLHMIARLVLGKDYDLGCSVTPGVDYVLTEVVHCKTIDENGVSDSCFRQCRDKWMGRVMDVACNVEYIVVVGGKAKENVAPIFSIANPKWWTWYSVCRNRRKYRVIFVYHSNAHRSYLMSLRDLFEANKKAGIGLSECFVGGCEKQMLDRVEVQGKSPLCLKTTTRVHKKRPEKLM